MRYIEEDEEVYVRLTDLALEIRRYVNKRGDKKCTLRSVATWLSTLELDIRASKGE